jgi:hypothetical protein
VIEGHEMMSGWPGFDFIQFHGLSCDVEIGKQMHINKDLVRWMKQRCYVECKH